jgi:hypothetical protein
MMLEIAYCLLTCVALVCGARGVRLADFDAVSAETLLHDAALVFANRKVVEIARLCTIFVARAAVGHARSAGSSRRVVDNFFAWIWNGRNKHGAANAELIDTESAVNLSVSIDNVPRVSGEATRCNTAAVRKSRKHGNDHKEAEHFF